MAVIKPARKFQGSEMSGGDLGRYILPEVPLVQFNKNNNKEGAWLFFLPAYKVDSNGNGVWYRVVNVRDNFGDKFKDKYAVIDPSTDPVAHFQKNFSLLFPDQAKVIEVEENGRKQKKYPLYGRVTKRVIYNVAYCGPRMKDGIHVIDLPMFNGADQLDKYHSTKDIQGNDRGMICDPDKCVPVFLKLNDGGGSPWQINPDPQQATALPEQFCDSDYLHNLDDIYIKKDPRELIAKLREMYRPDVFEACMEGYPGFKKTVAPGYARNPSEVDDEIDMTPAPAPAFSAPPIPKEPEVRQAPAVGNIPKSKVPASGKRADAPAPAIPQERVASGINPILGNSPEDIESFLNDND